MYFGKGFLNNGRARQTGQEKEMVAHAELQQELAAQAVHVSHGQDGQHVAVLFELASYGFHQVVHIAPQRAIG